MNPRVVLLNLVGVVLVAAAGFLGWLEAPFAWPTGLFCSIISGVLAVGLWGAVRADWGLVDWLSVNVTKIGLLGTVLGFIIALQHLDFAGDVSVVLSHVIVGFGVSLYATLLALVVNIWLRVNLFLFGRGSG